MRFVEIPLFNLSPVVVIVEAVEPLKVDVVVALEQEVPIGLYIDDPSPKVTEYK